MPVSSAYVADLAPADQRGLYMGTYGMTWSVAFVCGPSLGLLLFAASPLALWLTCGALGILAALIISSEPTPAMVAVEATRT
jgi:MFS family permease